MSNPIRFVGIMTVVCLFATLATAEPFETEFQFADGLRTLGYYDLAIGQFRQLDWGQQPDPARKTQVADSLIRTYIDALRGAPTAAEALDYARQADAEMARMLDVLKADADETRRNRLLMRQGELLMEQGQLGVEILQRKPLGINLDKAAAEAERAFDRTVDTFNKAAGSYREIVARLRAKPDVNDADRKVFRESLTQQVVAQTQSAWARFRRAGLFKSRGREDQAGAELRAAANIFQKISEEHRKIVAGVSATLGWALCLQETAEHQRAVEVFKDVLGSIPAEETRRMRFQARYDMAVSQAALGDYEGALDSLALADDELRGDISLEQRQGLALRTARMLGLQGDALRAQAEEKLKQAGTLAAKKEQDAQRAASRLREQAEDLREEYRRAYGKAAEIARVLAASDSHYAGEAGLLVGQWVAGGELKQQKTAAEFFADAERLFAEKQFDQAIDIYRNAIRVTKRTSTGKDITHDAWLKMGVAYVQTERFYEAGLVLGRLAALYPDSDMAEKSAVYSSDLLGAQYHKNKTDFEAQTYLEAQALLATRFSHLEKAQRAAFRLGDVRRRQEQFESAAAFYRTVPKASEHYEKAGYLAGQCLWLARGQALDSGRLERAKRLLNQTRRHLQDFLAWSEEQPAGNKAVAQARLLWTARSRVLLAEVDYTDKRCEDVLALLPEALIESWAAVDSKDDNLLGNARLHRLKAHIALGGDEHLRLAAVEFKALQESPAFDRQSKSTAARLVGVEFLALATRIADEEDVALANGGPRISALLTQAQKYLTTALELNPDQGAEAYDEIASSLYQAGAYREAGRSYDVLIERFGGRQQYADLLTRARFNAGIAYADAQDWTRVLDRLKPLVAEYPQELSARRALAQAYASDAVKDYAKAEAHWRVIEETLDARLRNSGEVDERMRLQDEWHEARYHRLQLLVRQGRKSLAFQLLVGMAYDRELGGPQWKDKFLAIRDAFDKDQVALFDRIREEALAHAPDGETGGQ